LSARTVNEKRAPHVPRSCRVAVCADHAESQVSQREDARAGKETHPAQNVEVERDSVVRELGPTDDLLALAAKVIALLLELVPDRFGEGLGCGCGAAKSERTVHLEQKEVSEATHKAGA